jgi:small-conductance mechanosensitive channel
MMEHINTIDLVALVAKALAFAERILFSVDGMVQLGWIVGALILGYMVSHIPLRHINRLRARNGRTWYDNGLYALESVIAPLISLLLLKLYTPFSIELGLQSPLVRVSETLLSAWVIIRFFSSFIHYPSLARGLAIFVWLVAALNVFGLLVPLVTELDSIGITFGENRISILTIAKGILAFGLLFWLSHIASRMIERRIDTIRQLTPSLRVLLSKIIRVSFIVLAFLIALNTIGIDLTSLAVFSGAVGVGIGFGLQKVVSNFISGIILLLDRSIKPGDVIAIDQTYGWVNKLSARHVSVITRDGKEHLIPNELLITERVENWSYSDRNIRLKIPVRISYQSDPRAALQLMLDAADMTPRVLKTPKPNALMTEFGESSIQLELRAWIDDPVNGIRNICSDLLLNIWDKFKENGIEVPYPQRDIHIKSGKITELTP